MNVDDGTCGPFFTVPAEAVNSFPLDMVMTTFVGKSVLGLMVILAFLITALLDFAISSMSEPAFLHVYAFE